MTSGWGYCNSVPFSVVALSSGGDDDRGGYFVIGVEEGQGGLGLKPQVAALAYLEVNARSRFLCYAAE